VVTRFKVTLFIVLYATITAVTVPSSASDSWSKYSKIPNKELKSRALTLVKGIRELVHSYSRTDRNLTADFDAEYLATRTTERQTLRDQWRKKIDEAQGASVRAYQRDFASDATLVREELQRRLPKSLNRRDLPKLYSNPPNVLALEVIADDLELLSKSLPDT
jgi:exonuclease VII large subunit